MPTATETTHYLLRQDLRPQKARILVIEDESELCALIREVLELEEYSVITTSSIQQAEEVLTSERFDVVISDLHLGPDDGLAFLQDSQARGRISRSVLITGDPRGIALNTLPNNCSLLMKPFRASELLHILEANI